MIESVCFTVFGRPVYWYGIFLAAGFGAGLFHLNRLGKREGREPGFASDLLFWLIVGGIVGARLAYVLGNWRDFAGSPGLILRVDKGGLVFYGGFFAAALGVALFARLRRVPMLKLYDYTVTALPLGHAFGRIGCFINGCCHGSPHAGWWSCTYPRHSSAWWSQVGDGLISEQAVTAIPVWPVQLFEAFANLLIYGVLLAATRRRHPDGAIVILYFLLYSTVRFGLEFLRGDLADRVVVHGLSSAQWVSLFLFAAALLAAGLLRLRARYAHAHRPA